VENGPSIDRFVQINPGVDYLWDGDNSDMVQFALYNWSPSHAPVNLAYIQQQTFAGSQFPASLMDRAYVTESGPTLGIGPQTRGKRIVEFTQNAAGTVTAGPTKLVEYAGNGAGSVVGLAAGPDGLYFTSLYNDDAKSAAQVALAIGPGAKVYRVRYVNPVLGDYDIDGDVDSQDYNPYRSAFGSNYLLAADGNGDNVVDAADYVVWRKLNGVSAGTSIVSDSKVGALLSSESIEIQTVEQSGSAPAASVDIAFAGFSAKYSNRLPRAVGRAYQHSTPLLHRHDLLCNQQFDAVDEPAKLESFDERSRDEAPGLVDIDELFSLLSL
jgi:hypothetical protein